MQSDDFASGLGGRRVDLARVSVEQAVEGAVPKGGREDAPQANHEEDEFNLNRGKKISHHNPRAKRGSGNAFCASYVPHLV